MAKFVSLFHRAIDTQKLTSHSSCPSLAIFGHLVFLLWLRLADDAMRAGGGLVCYDAIVTLGPSGDSVR